MKMPLTARRPAARSGEAGRNGQNGEQGRFMKLGSSSDIEAPIDFVFGQMSDFNAIERAAMRRGAEVQRVDDLTRNGPGMTWDTRFDLRGKSREIRLELTEYTPPEAMVFAFRSPSLSGTFLVDLVALSRTRTRVKMALSITPEALTGKLLVQSLKLARKIVEGKIDERMAGYSAEIEKRYRRSA